MPNEQEINRQVAERIRINQSVLAKLPPERQQAIYGIIFDKHISQSYSKLGLAPKDLQEAKKQWIDTVSGGKPQPLSGDFGVDKKEATTGKKALAFTEAAGAGVVGDIRNVSEFVSKYDKSDLSKDPIHKALAEVERRAYEDALAIDPRYAKAGGATGHGVGAQIAFEGVAGVVPTLGTTTKVLRSAAGGGAAAVAYGAKDTGEVGFQAAVNVAVDAIFHGMGQLGARGSRTIMERFLGSSNGAARQGAKQVDAAARVAAEKLKIDNLANLSPEQFDQFFKETKIAEQAAREKAELAAKALKEQTIASKPSREDVILQRAREQESRKEARKAASEASKKFQKSIVEYKKRTGKLPENEHLEALKSGKTTTDLLGEAPAKEAKVVKEALSEVTTAAHEAVLKEASPQTIEAVEAIKAIAPEVKIAKPKPVKESMFKTDMSGILGATSAEEFAKAKREATTWVVDESRRLGKDMKSADEGLRIAAEAKKEMQRIKTIPVPETFSKKSLDLVRKQGEATQVGMEVAEAEQGQKSQTIGLKAEQQMADPQMRIIEALDSQKVLLSKLGRLIPPERLESVKKSIAGDDVVLQNTKLQRAIDALEKVKGPAPERRVSPQRAALAGSPVESRIKFLRAQARDTKLPAKDRKLAEEQLADIIAHPEDFTEEDMKRGIDKQKVQKTMTKEEAEAESARRHQ